MGQKCVYMKILKFGGTSISSVESLESVKEIILANHQKVAVVVSAFSGITNKLAEIAEAAADSNKKYLNMFKEVEKRHFDMVKALIKVQNQSQVFAALKKLTNELEDLLNGVFLIKELSPKTMDLVFSFGERLSTNIISQFLNQHGVNSKAVDARCLIKTDNRFGLARVNFALTNSNIKQHFSKHTDLQIITGFIGSTEKKETTTIGRGGSDYTAAILAAALDAVEIEIWTDVDGVMTADPREVKRSFSLPTITYNETMEMSHFGAKVIYPPTIQPALEKKIPLIIRNTFNLGFEGTRISMENTHKSMTVKGISSIKEISLINLMGSGMIGIPGIASRLFGSLAKNEINVILITQASSEHSISFAVTPQDTRQAKATLLQEFELEMQLGKIDNPIIENDLSIVAIVGENMRNAPGVASKMFGALGKNGINIAAIAQGSSELNISAVINRNNLKKALNAIHEVFFLSDKKTLNVFMIGVGLIGGTLIKQIKDQHKYLLNERNLNIRLVAISNSKKMLFDEEGIDLENWKEHIEGDKGLKTNLDGFVSRMIDINLMNSVFVDNTSNENVIRYYSKILAKSITIVTPNKLANSGNYAEYDKLKKLSQKHNVKFLYETNVGAGLPVIKTLNDLIDSGDEIIKIEGILSGTLSYIFNEFVGDISFTSVVKKAKEKGLTEPDPRNDLSGIDVARKILILARESGLKAELEDIEVQSILPEACLKADSINSFFKELEKVDDYFEQMKNNAESANKKLRFMASLENGKARVALEAVDSNHPFYILSGSDNIISYVTKRYLERPLVVKGPGAGAEVTAGGIFAEIIQVSHYLSTNGES